MELSYLEGGVSRVFVCEVGNVAWRGDWDFDVDYAHSVLAGVDWEGGGYSREEQCEDSEGGWDSHGGGRSCRRRVVRERGEQPFRDVKNLGS